MCCRNRATGTRADRLETVTTASSPRPESAASTAREINPGDRIELTITDVAHGGVFIARHEDGRVVFVADALPGERVIAEVSQVQKKFARASVVEVLDAAAERRDHVWDAASISRAPADRAGGAEFGHMLPADSRELKRRVLADALARFGGLDATTVSALSVEAIGDDDATRGTGWRTRLTLHIDEAGNVGPYAARSHRVVPVDSLPLAFADIEEAAMHQIRRGGTGPARLEFVAPADLEVRMRRVREGKTPRAGGTIRERVGAREFALAESGFWQVHRHAAETLYRAVAEAVDETLLDASAQHLDLYGGVGLLGAALAERIGADARIASVEADAFATGFAAQNLREWSGATAATGRVDRYLRERLQRDDAATRGALRRGTVVLDPPRSGAGGDVVSALGKLAPAQLVYVACDPVALARDTGLLREQGYELARIRAFDLFPNTHHVETVASFVRAQ